MIIEILCHSNAERKKRREKKSHAIYCLCVVVRSTWYIPEDNITVSQGDSDGYYSSYCLLHHFLISGIGIWSFMESIASLTSLSLLSVLYISLS